MCFCSSHIPCPLRKGTILIFNIKPYFCLFWTSQSYGVYFLGLASLTRQILWDLPTLLHVVLGICTTVYSILLSTLQCYLSILLLTYTEFVSDFGHYQQCCYKPSRTCLLVNMDTHTLTPPLHTHTHTCWVYMCKHEIAGS